VNAVSSTITTPTKQFDLPKILLNQQQQNQTVVSGTVNTSQSNSVNSITKRYVIEESATAKPDSFFNNCRYKAGLVVVDLFITEAVIYSNYSHTMMFLCKFSLYFAFSL